MSLSGLFVPLITPFTATGEIATEALQKLATGVLDDGAAGLVALGTTAESATLTTDERRTVVDVCAEAATERGAPLIVGTGSNSTVGSIDMLAELGPRATAALAVVPYYTRPSEDGIVEHFRRLAAESPVPLVVYNIPYRTGTTLSAGTLSRLARIPNVVGFKHSVGGIDNATVSFMSEGTADFSVLAGDDLYAGPLVALGASGAILASANVAPSDYSDLIAAWRDGPVDHARERHDRLVPLTHALFAEPNPVVIKAVLAALGRIPTPDVRLPLLAARAESLATALGAIPNSDRSRGPHGRGRRRTAGPRSPGRRARCGS
jgi:4-hydroxy-tetrahydrodipicolinate synthase